MFPCFVNQNSHKTVNMVVHILVKNNENTYPERKSTHTNVQSCPSNEKGILEALCHSESQRQSNV